MKPGLGRYDKEDESLTRRSTQIRFLVVAGFLEPRLLPDLHNRTYNLFWELILSLRKHKLPFEFEDWRSLQNVDGATALCKELQEWSKVWNLDADWCRDQAIKTLWRWRRMTRTERGFYWEGRQEYDYSVLKSGYDKEIFKVSYSQPSIQPPPGFPEWRPATELKEIYLDGVEAKLDYTFEENPILLNAELSSATHFKKTIMDKAISYCDNVEKKYNELQGWKKTDVKPRLAKSLIWTVLFQVMKLDYDDIADIFKTKSDTVGTGVRRMLKLIDLGMRADARQKGKPRETSQKLPSSQLKAIKNRVQSLAKEIEDRETAKQKAMKSEAKLLQYINRRHPGIL